MAQKNFLDRLSGEDLAALRRALTRRSFSRGAIVISQSEADTEVYFVQHGTAQVTVFGDDGKVVAYRELEAGSVFGELSAIDGAPRSANVTATSDLTVGCLSQADFRELVETNTGFVWALTAHLSWQIRDLTTRIYAYSTMPVRQRVAMELVRMCGDAEVSDGVFTIKSAPTHFDLAARISSHREAVSREMSELTKLGIISKRKKQIIVHDLARLNRVMGMQSDS